MAEIHRGINWNTMRVFIWGPPRVFVTSLIRDPKNEQNRTQNSRDATCTRAGPPSRFFFRNDIRTSLPQGRRKSRPWRWCVHVVKRVFSHLMQEGVETRHMQCPFESCGDDGGGLLRQSSVFLLRYLWPPGNGTTDQAKAIMEKINAQPLNRTSWREEETGDMCIFLLPFHSFHVFLNWAVDVSVWKLDSQGLIDVFLSWKNLSIECDTGATSLHELEETKLTLSWASYVLRNLVRHHNICISFTQDPVDSFSYYSISPLAGFYTQTCMMWFGM